MIHVIGNAAIDTILHIDRFPRPGETIVARGACRRSRRQRRQSSDRRRALRGPMSGSPRHSATTRPALRIRRSLKRRTWLTDSLAAFGGATDRCLIMVDAAGENMIVSLIDAARAFDPAADARLDASIAPGDWVLMQGNLGPP